jgi:hypothetical protein
MFQGEPRMFEVDFDDVVDIRELSAPQEMVYVVRELEARAEATDLSDG